MKSRWFTVLSRFWPGLMSLAIVFSLLAWIMQPRTREKRVVKLPPEQGRNIREETVNSQDNKYVAVNYSIHDQSGTGTGQEFIVYDTVAFEKVFQISGTVRQITFEPSGTLLFRVEPKNAFGSTVPVDEQLLRWNAQTRSTQIVFEYHLPGSHSAQLELSSSLLPRKTYWHSNWSLLSPDARTWIVPCFDERAVWYERIDVASGKSRGRLALPEMLHGKSKTSIRGIRFTDDSEVIVVQTSYWSENKYHYRLHWLQTSSGQELGSMPLPTDLIGISYASNDLLVAEAYLPSNESRRENDVYVIRRREQSLRCITLEDIQPNQQKRPDSVDPKYVLPGVQVEHQVEPVSQTLVTSWNYHFTEATNMPGTVSLPIYLTDLHYAVRDLNTGKVLHSDCMKFPNTGGPLGVFMRGASLQAVLPGLKLFVTRANDKSENRFQEWIEWLQLKLNMDQDVFKQTHYVVDGKTGKTLWEMHAPSNLHQVNLSPDQSTLTLINGSLEHYLYDYPLHQPWLLIWTWALGAAGVITLFVEMQRWRRYRRLKFNS